MSDTPSPTGTTPARRYPHCVTCGRFVRSVWTPSGPDIHGEYPESEGTCKAHGDVRVTWEAP